ncbi:MAG: DEAD/DEAH box helicase family protein [Bacteroidetes bacterium]|nr:DEAD/DEAH box helicase family protein [Bacteroidota bacterium]
MKDPVLLRLEPATQSALVNGNIHCLEDLLQMDPDDISSLNGIGKKRNLEILRLLYSLPFDFKQKPSPVNPGGDGLLGVDQDLRDLIIDLMHDRNDQTFKRGLAYFRENRVKSVELLYEDEDQQECVASVKGSRQYEVRLVLDGGQYGEECSCPAFKNYYGYGMSACKHIVAAVFALGEKQRLAVFESKGDVSPAYLQLEHTLKNTMSSGLSLVNGKEELEYMLVRRNGDWSLYPKKIYPQLIGYQKRGGYYYTHNPAWDRLPVRNSRDELIVSCLFQIHENSRSYDHYSKSSRSGLVSEGEILDLAAGRNLYVKLDNKPAQLTHFMEEPFRLTFHISRNRETGAGLKIECRLRNGESVYSGDEVEFVHTDPAWILTNGSIGKLEASELALQLYNSTKRSHIDVPESELDSFLKDLYPLMTQAGMPVEFSDDLKLHSQDAEPVPRLYLSENGHTLIAELRFAYGRYEIDYGFAGDEILTPACSDDVDEQSKHAPFLVSIRRQHMDEQMILQKLLTFGMARNGSTWRFMPENDPLEWALETLPELVNEGFEIYGQQELTRYKRPRKMTSSSFRVKSKDQWFEAEGSFSFGDIELTMSDVERVLVKNKHYVKLTDGSFGELPQNWVDQLKKLERISGETGEKKESKIPRIAASVLNDVGREADHYESDPDLEQYARRLQSFEEIEEIEPPKEFKGDLRAYQSAGLSWMNFLNSYGFGGILADDMGLGKTIQVLSLLKHVSEFEERSLRTLVIAPRSVLQNWKAEATTFVPDFQVDIHHGTDRAEKRDELPECDILLTTYATMRNDIDMLSKIEFDYAILDESHTVRNPESKTFRALRKIKAKNRLCMTGTPVQNTTMDLWSQFEFLNPGLLGNKTSFRTQWVKPVEEKNDTVAEELLHKMVSPFILRRTKGQVATDLPPLTSTLVECPMETVQQTLYEKYRKTYYELVNKTLDTDGLQKARFTVLEGLLRLRQICCSPRLIDGETAPSAKIARFMELASELISEGHRALIFSQFVGFLKQIEKEVQNAGWSYEYLDGQTADRQERVDQFQKDDSKKLFLISLKAGGEGLNLTGADYVFIMDPWWNPAAERQAMDRTHRIGQKENVFVYRFMTPGSVEEKILRLQDRKRELAEKLVVAESGIFKELEKEDLIALFE